MLPINATKGSQFAFIYASTYAYIVPCGLLSVYDNNVPYSYSIATLLTVLPLCHQIPLYNKLTTTNRPKLHCCNYTYHDSLIINYLRS